MNNLDRKYGQTFGKQSSVYDATRPTMPEEVMGYLFEFIQESNPKILDVGCGTGIVSRQMVQYGAVVSGTDVDPEMIEVAQAKNTEKIEYIAAPTEKLPFEDKSFDAVTAFSSFHWFANKEASMEMLRVLRPDGLVFIANRYQQGEFRKNYINTLKECIPGEMPDSKKDFNPKELLEGVGFVDVKERTFKSSEKFSVMEAVEHIKTTSFWGLIPDSKKDQALKSLGEFFKRSAIDGMVIKDTDIKTVIGRKLN